MRTAPVHRAAPAARLWDVVGAAPVVATADVAWAGWVQKKRIGSVLWHARFLLVTPASFEYFAGARR